MKDIKTYSPGKLPEALKILSENAPDIKVMSGGTDLVVQILERKKDASALLDISHLDELRYIKEEDGSVRIGALITHREIEKSALIRRCAPLLREGVFIIASPQLRNLATIGGNIVNASPVADTVPPLMVLDAVIKLRSRSGERDVPVRKFFRGPGKSVIKPDELLVDVAFKKPGPDDRSFYERLGQRRLLAISKVGVAFKASLKGKRMSGVAVALGAVAPMVIMAPRTAAFLEGKEYSREVAEEAARLAGSESKAITDIRSTESYRNRMAGALLLRGLERVMESP